MQKTSQNSDNQNNKVDVTMANPEFARFRNIVNILRSENGCPWDREQTHTTLKKGCIEEACEVVCGINIYDKTGVADNLKEELGDLLLQIVMHAQIAEEEGLFTMEDVCKGIADKMVRRHPHVFGTTEVSDSEEVLKNWEEIKKSEHAGETVDVNAHLFEAFDESKDLIDVAIKRKREKLTMSGKKYQ